MLRSPGQALLWEIWIRHRSTMAAILGVTAVGRLIDYSEQTASISEGSTGNPLVELLMMAAFALLLGVFNYTESDGSDTVGQFPHRLFTLPVSSQRLVMLPMVTGVVAIELLYLLWLDPITRGDSVSAVFVAVLLGAMMVFYQSILWTLARLGPMRLVIIGAVAIGLFVVGMLPSFPPDPPPLWRSQMALAAYALSMALVAFLVARQHVTRLRYGGPPSAHVVDSAIAMVAAAIPSRRRSFASPLHAHFWFEWRCSGMALPALVGAAIVLVLVPLSVMDRTDPAGTLRVLMGACALPIALSLPLGLGFAKADFWSSDLSMPAFVAVRPLTDADIVATKVKVAAASVVASWLLVLAFIGLSLFGWATFDGVRPIVSQLSAGRSAAGAVGLAALILLAAMLLTWRFLVNRLWTGLSGNRRLFSASSMVVVTTIMLMALDTSWALEWLIEDPTRLTAVIWAVALAVLAKIGLATFTWRRVSTRYLFQYLAVWAAGTACFVGIVFVAWGPPRLSPANGASRLALLMMLLALLAVPLARVGAAPSLLARNRHR